MNKRNVIACILFLLAISIAVFLIFYKQENPTSVCDEQKEIAQKEQASRHVVHNNEVNIKSKSNIIKTNLYKNTSDNSIPLEGISELSNLPDNIKNFADLILNNANNIYFIKQNKNKVVFIYDNPESNTHGISVTEIITESGAQKDIFSSEEHITYHDTWLFDETKEQKLPIKHIKYDDDENLVYTEVWNYSPDEEIKYEKKDADDNPISIKKEVIDTNGDLRQEHLIYDKDGNTQINISAAYKGANIVRFTYYNALEPEFSFSIFSEYSAEGQKIKETVYSSDFKVQNIYVPTIKNNERESIKILDSRNQEVSTLYSE